METSVDSHDGSKKAVFFGPSPAPPPHPPLQGAKMFKGCRSQGLHLGTPHEGQGFSFQAVRHLMTFLLGASWSNPAT